jgi:hypothetical protein
MPPKKPSAERDYVAEIKAYLAENPPVRRSGGWAESVLPKEVRDLVAESYAAGYGATYLARMLVAIGFEDATMHRLATFLSKLPPKPRS